MGFQLSDDYVDVPARIREFREKYPEGRLRPEPGGPFHGLIQADGKWYVAYTAAALRGPDDAMPGVGTAWEPFPGTTPYTKNSELQNAETSAWGRAIVAALAADAKKIATAEDIQNRQAEREAEPQPVKESEPGWVESWTDRVTAAEDLDTLSALWKELAAADGKLLTVADALLMREFWITAKKELQAKLAGPERQTSLVPDPDASPSGSGLKVAK